MLPQVPPLLAAVGMGGVIALLRLHLAPYAPDAIALPALVVLGGLLYAIGIVMLMPRRAILSRADSLAVV